jgi:hypothetical protein
LAPGTLYVSVACIPSVWRVWGWLGGWGGGGGLEKGVVNVCAMHGSAISTGSAHHHMFFKEPVP